MISRGHPWIQGTTVSVVRIPSIPGDAQALPRHALWGTSGVRPGLFRDLGLDRGHMEIWPGATGWKHITKG